MPALASSGGEKYQHGPRMSSNGTESICLDITYEDRDDDERSRQHWLTFGRTRSVWEGPISLRFMAV